MDVALALSLEGKRSGPIRGEGKDDKITIENFSFGATRPMSGGSATGRLAHADVTFFKYCDVSTPLLLAMMDSNDQIKKAKLFVYKMGGKQELFFSIELFDGIMTNFESLGYSGGGAGSEKIPFPTKQHAIRERFSVSFGKMSVDYYIQNSDGSMKQNTNYTIQVRDV